MHELWKSFKFYSRLTCICHSLILSREGLILTLSILPCPEGWISWSIPVDGLMMRRMSVLHQNSGGIGKSIPSALEISLDPRDFPRASPSGNLSGLGKSLGRRGWISQYLPRFGGAGIHSWLQQWWTNLTPAVDQKNGWDGLKYWAPYGSNENVWLTQQWVTMLRSPRQFLFILLSSHIKRAKKKKQCK